MKKLMHKNMIALPALGVVCAGTVLAQDVGDFEGLERGFSTKSAVGLGLGYRAESDIDDGGESSLLSLRLAGGTAMTLNEKLGLSFLAAYTFNHYDFKGFFTDPWEDIHTVRTAPLLHYRIDDEWSVFGGPAIGFSAEDGADLGDSFTAGGIVGFGYRANDRLTVGMALGVFSRIEDDAAILPLPIVDWRFAEDWTLRVGFQEVAANGGVGAKIGYNLNEKWEFGAGVQFQQRRFRLSEDGPVPDGVGRDRSASVYLEAKWKATEKCALEALIGIAAGGEYRIEDEDGHKLGDTDYDPSALIGVRGVFTF